MATIRVDFAQASKGGIPVPDGEYICEVVQIVEAESSRSKSPQLHVTLEVAEGPAKGGKITDFMPLADGAMWRRANLFRACGFDEEGEADVNTDDICRLNEEGDAIAEQGAMITVRKQTSVEEFEGKERRRVNLQFYRLATAEGAAPAAPAPASKPSISKKPAVKGPVSRKVNA
jgi:hypothetical protein